MRHKEEGVQNFLHIVRRGIVSFSLQKVDLELHMRQQNKFHMKHVKCCLTFVVRRVLREVVYIHLKLAQRYENWTIDDWKCMIFSDDTNIHKFNSNDRS